MEKNESKESLLAEEFFEKSDSKALFELYKSSEKGLQSCVDTMAIVIDRNKGNRPQFIDDAPINAMKEVALKALELAQSVFKDNK